MIYIISLCVKKVMYFKLANIHIVNENSDGSLVSLLIFFA
jgi:hypothetical protein